MIEMLDSLACHWWQWIVGVSLQVAIVAIAVALLDKLLRRWGWPQLLLVLWLVILLRCLLPAELSAPISVAAVAPPVLQFHEAVSLSNAKLVAMAGTPGALFLGWILTILLFACIAIRRYRTQQRHWLAGATTDLPDEIQSALVEAASQIGLRHPPKLFLAEKELGPAVLGFLKPIVVVPKSLLVNKSSQHIHHVLLHELAHVKRRDSWIALLCMAIQFAFWFHPAIWMTRRRLGVLMEICCDRVVAEVLKNERLAYRGTLLEMARPLLQPAPAWQLGFITPRSQIMQRLDWLTRTPSRFAFSGWLATAITLVLLSAILLPMSQSVAEALPGIAEAPQIGSIAQQSSTLETDYQQLQGSLRKKYFLLNLMAESDQESSQTVVAKENHP